MNSIDAELHSIQIKNNSLNYIFNAIWSVSLKWKSIDRKKRINKNKKCRHSLKSFHVLILSDPQLSWLIVSNCRGCGYRLRLVEQHSSINEWTIKCAPPHKGSLESFNRPFNFHFESGAWEQTLVVGCILHFLFDCNEANVCWFSLLLHVFKRLTMLNNYLPYVL